MSQAFPTTEPEQTETLLHPALVIGGGIAGSLAVNALKALGLTVVYIRMADQQSNPFWPYLDPYSQDIAEHLGITAPHPETFDLAEIPSVRREGPFFRMHHEGLTERLFGCVVVATGAALTTAPEQGHPNEDLLQPTHRMSGPQRLGLVLDFGRPSDPYAGIAALSLALRNQAAGGTSTVVFQNIPVAHEGAEELYDRAKRAGVVFVRYDAGSPPVVDRLGQTGESVGFRVTVIDSVSGGHSLEMEFDHVAFVGFPDGRSIDDRVRSLAGHDVDVNGFLLSESIHTSSGRSFTNGVFAVGQCTGLFGLPIIMAQAHSMAVKARSWLRLLGDTAAAEKVTVSDECIRCLTCYRLCPHTSISVNYATSRSKISASAASCQQCGICVSECPRGALDLNFFPEIALAGFVDEMKKIDRPNAFVVYGCERSTADLMAKMHLPPEALFFSVPCAGRISEPLLWSTLTTGISGILVVGCHPGNCASKYGTEWAGKRVNEVLIKMQAMGIAAPLISYTSLSSREVARFERIVHEFAASIRANQNVFLQRNES